MSYSSYGRPELELNLVDVMWRLISQWKAIIVFALIISFFSCGFQYVKDVESYEDVKNKQKEIDTTTQRSAEELTAEILDSLSNDERATVEYVINQKEWIEKEKEYLNNSLLLNCDPADQRTLFLDYDIAAVEGSNITEIAVAYENAAFIKRESLIKALKAVIRPEIPDIKDQYIVELIYFQNKINSYSVAPTHEIIEVSVILPDGVDESAVQKIIESEIEDYSKEINNKISAHRISLLSSTVSRIYNSGAVDRRTNLNYSIYNMQNNIRNIETTLSEEEKAAIEGIINARSTSEKVTETSANTQGNADSESKADKPKIRKKPIAYGFVIGVFLYGLLYLLWVISKGRITSAKQTETYTSCRLLGEVYFEPVYKGINWLTHSKTINRLRFREKTEADKQIERLCSTLEALCEYTQMDNLTLFCLPYKNTNLAHIIEKIISRLKKESIEINVVNVNFDTIESEIVKTKYAVCLSNSENKANELIKLTELLHEYEKELLGNLYVEVI